MVDTDPDELKDCAVEFPALLYVNPKEWQPDEERKVRQGYFAIPGKHRNEAAAWEAIEAAVAASPAVSKALQ